MREPLSSAELVVFDLLTCPGPDLSPSERDEVKMVVRKLLGRLHEILTIDWQKTNQARARVKSVIEEALDQGLPRNYTPDAFQVKAGVVFQHVYERFERPA